MIFEDAACRGIEPSDPPLTRYESDTALKLAWLEQHPGEWLKWGTKQYPVNLRAIHGPRYERAYRRIDGKYALWVRRVA